MQTNLKIKVQQCIKFTVSWLRKARQEEWIRSMTGIKPFLDNFRDPCKWRHSIWERSLKYLFQDRPWPRHFYTYVTRTGTGSEPHLVSSPNLKGSHNTNAEVQVQYWTEPLAFAFESMSTKGVVGKLTKLD